MQLQEQNAKYTQKNLCIFAFTEERWYAPNNFWGWVRFAFGDVLVMTRLCSTPSWWP